MERRDYWRLFFATGLPQAYTYCKERERRAERHTKRDGPPGRTGAS